MPYFATRAESVLSGYGIEGACLDGAVPSPRALLASRQAIAASG